MSVSFKIELMLKLLSIAVKEDGMQEQEGKQVDNYSLSAALAFRLVNQYIMLLQAITSWYSLLYKVLNK